MVRHRGRSAARSAPEMAALPAWRRAEILIAARDDRARRRDRVARARDGARAAHGDGREGVADVVVARHRQLHPALHVAVDHDRDNLRGAGAIFHAGFREFARLRENADMDPMDVVEGARRSMRVALSREMDALETYLSFLATVGSTSPYVGLFGTVWGIMVAFMQIGSMQTATLAVVAPPIAEALIATATGLFAAIPAVVLYNAIAKRLDELEEEERERLENILDYPQKGSPDYTPRGGSS